MVTVRKYNCSGIITYLELALKTSKISFWISFAQYLDASLKIAGTDLSIATCNSLKNSIMDEDILFLHCKHKFLCTML